MCIIGLIRRRQRHVAVAESPPDECRAPFARLSMKMWSKAGAARVYQPWCFLCSPWRFTKSVAMHRTKKAHPEPHMTPVDVACTFLSHIYGAHTNKCTWALAASAAMLRLLRIPKGFICVQILADIFCDQFDVCDIAIWLIY